VIFEATVDGRTARVEVRRAARPAAEGSDAYTVLLDGRPLEVDLRPAGRGFVSLLVDGRSYEVALHRRDGGFTVSLEDAILEVALTEAARGPATLVRKAAAGPTRVVAPMPGKLVRVLVAAGQDVAAGQGLVVMEAMKMENEIRAPRAGRVREVSVQERQTVETGALLVLLD
jgi:biotin carboxyl carrier protein